MLEHTIMDTSDNEKKQRHNYHKYQNTIKQ